MTNKTPLVIIKSNSLQYKAGMKLTPGSINDTAAAITSMGIKCKEHSVWVAHGVQQIINPQTLVVVDDTIRHGASKPAAPDCNLYTNEAFEVNTKEAFETAGAPGTHKRLNSDSSCGDYPLSFDI